MTQKVIISGNRSYGVMNPPQSSVLSIIAAVWDHLDRKQNKRQPTSKEELWNVKDVLKQMTRKLV